jgi:hypothetical protein
MAKRPGFVRRLFGAGVTALALAAGVAHLVAPNLKIDAITVLLLVVALLPWLGELLESIELPGGWKLQYRALADKVEETEQQASQAATRAREAVSTANVAIGATRIGDRTVVNSIADVNDLIDEYRQLRQLPASPGRTQQMDQLFGRMVVVVSTTAQFDAAAALKDDDPAVRLTGYASLYGVPDPTMIDVAIDALVKERRLTSSFNEYWAIMVVRALAARDPVSLNADRRARLELVLNQLPIGSRRVQLAALLGTAKKDG